MPALQRTVATLRISGSDLDPDEISRLLGCSPTRSHRKGETPERSHGVTWLPAKVGNWRLDATPTEPEDFNGQVSELLDQMSDDLAIWHNLADRFRVDLFCGWFMQERNEGIDIEPRTLSMLGTRHIVLALDIYGPDEDA